MKKTMYFLLLCSLLAFAACAGDEAPAGYDEHVEFTWHLNYTWVTTHPWGADAVSRHWGEKFNIHAHMSSPDAIADEVLNLMIMADDLPDAIWMDRGAFNAEMTRLGLFYSIDELVAMVDNNWYHENVPAATQNHYAVDGVNHTIPNWVRMGEFGVPGGATGGNHSWLKTTNVHAAVGSPQFVTLEDLYAYAVAVRDANLTNHAGVPIYPCSSMAGRTSARSSSTRYSPLLAEFPKAGRAGTTSGPTGPSLSSEQSSTTPYGGMPCLRPTAGTVRGFSPQPT